MGYILSKFKEIIILRRNWFVFFFLKFVLSCIYGNFGSIDILYIGRYVSDFIVLIIR